MTTCTETGCDRLVKSRGWCGMHYHRWQRHGDPSVVLPMHRPPAQLAGVAYIVTEGGCWVAPERISATGYAYIGAKLAHRLAYETHVGPIPTGFHVDHLCHNRDLTCEGGTNCLHRACFNPEHLQAVTPRTNILRSPTSTAGVHARKSHCPSGHPYTPENTYLHGGSRHCKTCSRTRAARGDAATAKEIQQR